MPMRLSSQRGMTLFTVLFAIMVIGLMLGLAGQTWSQVMQREREEELFFRGDQYRLAIQSYYEKSPGGAGVFPTALQQLLNDNRQATTVRHLRKLWPEPFSGGEWELIIQPPDLIIGVRSSSLLAPFRQDGFPEEYATFKSAPSYNKWEFIYTPKKVLPQEKALPTPEKSLPGKPETP